MEKLHSFYKDDILTLQRSEYIEDGWYIEYHWMEDKPWKLFEIPMYGGNEHLHGCYEYFHEAYNVAKTELI